MQQATLSTSGWVTDPRQIATNLIEYYNSSDPNQSTLLLENVRSVTDLALKYCQEPILLAQAIEQDLKMLFSAYFKNVDIAVKSVLDPDVPGRFNIVVEGSYVHNNNRYGLNEKFDVSESGGN